MKLSLIVLTSGKQEGKAIEIKGPEFLVGRDPECQLRPASPLISKRHCAIVLGDGKAVVRDFGSTNGTFLNDQPVKGEAELHNDDQLKIGPLHFRVRLEAPAAKPKPAPAPAAKPGPKPAPKPGPGAKAPARAAAPAPKPAAGEDEDIAAMLLSLPGEEGEAGPAGAAPEVPEGSTVHDIAVPPALTGKEPPQPEANQPPKPPDKGAQSKPATGNTSNAAAELLKKYMTRPRSGS